MYRSLRIDKNEINSDILTAIIFENGGEGIEETNDSYICSFGDLLNVESIILVFQETFEITLRPSDFVEVKNENWMENWKKNFKPINVGDHFLVKPTWEAVNTERHVIEIDAKMAFGTGTHETTQIVMEFLPNYINPDLTMLDVGCGSGILSIAADRLGCNSVTAFDIDEVAMVNCNENIQINSCSKISTFTGNINDLADTFDIVVANIISKVLLSISNELINKMKIGGYLILSGILLEEEKAILSSFKELECIEKKVKGEWCGFVFKKK